MLKKVLVFASILSSCLVAGCANVQDSAQSTSAFCEFENVAFYDDFDGARINDCKKTDNGVYELSTFPENQPINPSPWYAFKVAAKSEATNVTIAIKAKDARPRYLPNVSIDGENWEKVPFWIKNQTLYFKTEVSTQPLFVAAQPMLVSANYQQWHKINRLSQKYEQIVIGESVQGRKIDALVHRNAQNKEWFIVIGRQHPPELTGAFAAMDFIAAISEENALTEAFFERFNILIVPLLNPDGVANGHWRHNVNGVDLNRDWGKFTQPETKAVGQFIENNVSPNGNIVFALDFHSTQQDIFYTMPTDYGLEPQYFSEHWLQTLRDKRIGSFTVRERPGSAPGRGVFKQYIADNFGVHSVTYEMGDNTPRDMIRHIAQLSAETLMSQLLNTDKEAFLGGKAKIEKYTSPTQ